MSTNTTTKRATKAQTLADLQALATGLQSQFPNGSFTLESTVFTTQSLVTLINGVIDALSSLNAAQLAAKAAVPKARAALTQAEPTLSALRRNLLAAFGNAPQTLAIFGLKPLKAKAPKTSEQKAVAAAKARATRTAPSRQHGSGGHHGLGVLQWNLVPQGGAGVGVLPDPASGSGWNGRVRIC